MWLEEGLLVTIDKASFPMSHFFSDSYLLLIAMPNRSIYYKSTFWKGSVLYISAISKQLLIISDTRFSLSSAYLGQITTGNHTLQMSSLKYLKD